MTATVTRIRTAVALVALAVLAGACSSGAAPSASPAAPDPTAAPAATETVDATPSLAGTTVTIWTMEDAAKFATLVKPFEDQTGIKVDVEAVPWDAIGDKLTTAVASGNGPDVTQIGLSLLPTFNAAGALEDLAPYLGAHPALASSNFPDAVSSANLTSGGKVTSVPWVADTRVLFYRTDIFAEVGLSGPPTTADEMMTAAEKLAARGDGQYGYYIPQWDAPLPIQFTWQAGGDVVGPDGTVTLDTPEFRRAVDRYAAFFENNLVPTASDFDQTAGFISGAAPMLVSGPYLAAGLKDQAPELDGKWAVTTMPKDVTGTALFAGSNMGVWKGSDNVEGALALLDFLAAPETQVAWFQATSQLPTNIKASTDPAVTADPNVAVYSKQLQDAKLLPLIPAWDKIGSEILTSLNKIVLEGADKEATLATLFQTVGAMK
jgi:multiple sugar transport system substrate-binding protein